MVGSFFQIFRQHRHPLTNTFFSICYGVGPPVELFTGLHHVICLPLGFCVDHSQNQIDIGCIINVVLYKTPPLTMIQARHVEYWHGFDSIDTHDEDYDKTARRLIHLNILFIDDILDIFDENRVGTIRILNKLNTIRS